MSKQEFEEAPALDWKENLRRKVTAIEERITKENRSCQQTASETNPMTYLVYETALKIMGGSKKQAIYSFIAEAKRKDAKMFESEMRKYSEMSEDELLEVFPERNSGSGRKRTLNVDELLETD